MRNILLGVTGSVAAIKTAELNEKLSDIGSVTTIVTKSGQYFAERSRGQRFNYIADISEWPEEYNLGDPILHIELRRKANVLVVAPLDANTLAKMALGLCDNLLTCVVRAWDWNKPMILCPAMNSHMMEHPLTDKYLKELESWGATVIPPQCKKLACGDIGNGAMADISVIVENVNLSLTNETQE